MTAQLPQLLANSFALNAHTAIVTGATGGLGLTMTLALAEAGANVISIEMPDDPASSELQEQVDKSGRYFERHECDVKDSTQLRSVFASIWKQADELKDSRPLPNILINCAGINRRGPAEQLTDE